MAEISSFSWLPYRISTIFTYPVKPRREQIQLNLYCTETILKITRDNPMFSYPLTYLHIFQKIHKLQALAAGSCLCKHVCVFFLLHHHRSNVILNPISERIWPTPSRNQPTRTENNGDNWQIRDATDGIYVVTLTAINNHFYSLACQPHTIVKNRLKQPDALAISTRIQILFTKVFAPKY